MNKYEEIIMHYGKVKQVDKAIEELEELSIELLRYQAKSGNKKNMIEEIADVVNMIYQLMYIFGIKKDDLKKVMDLKIKRTLNFIEQEKENHKNVSFYDKQERLKGRKYE